MAGRVFIIHGRDTEARDELVKFIEVLGLEAHTFADVVNESGAAPIISRVVERSIRSCNAVIALFTPDEQATLYSQAGERQSDRQDSRWQARPNVIFEAGLAWGIAQNKTILATIGPDVRSLFSNLSGFHSIELENNRAKENLRIALSRILKKELKPHRRNWRDPAVSGNFEACVRRRWPYYDELQELESHLRGIEISNPPISLFEVVKGVATEHPNKNWKRQTSKQFMEAVRRLFHGKRGTEDAYWWLVVYGFFRFKGIHKWWRGEKAGSSWRTSVEYSELTERGLMLITRLQKLSD